MTLREKKKNANKEPSVSAENWELFHYTSLHALEGILENNTLWATHAGHLNDSSEMKLLWPKLKLQFIAYLKAVFESASRRDPEIRETVERLGGAHRIAEQDGPKIIDVMWSLLFGDESRHGMGIPFITSFTTHKEEYHFQNGMLSQWRGYGDDQGVAIVFDTEKLKDLLHSKECTRFLYLNCLAAPAVYYDKGLDLEVCFQELFDTLKQYSEDFISRFRDNEKAQQNQEKLARNLLPAIGRLKHQAFREEIEYRIVVGVVHESHADKLSQFEGEQRPFKMIHHRSGSCGSIPYIRLFEGLDEELPILRILVGPSRNQPAISEAVRELLNRLGRGQAIKVQESEIPYVSSS